MRPLINVYSNIFFAVAALHVFIGEGGEGRAGKNVVENVGLIFYDIYEYIAKTWNDNA